MNIGDVIKQSSSSSFGIIVNILSGNPIWSLVVFVNGKLCLMSISECEVISEI